MGSEEDQLTKVANDKELVARMISDDDDAWEIFVERYTDWVLYKSKEWCIEHCQYSSGTYSCGLLSLKLQRKGKNIYSDQPECDEGLDTYIWIFERLKNKVKKYSGKNNCLLSTFVWTILNSRELHIDWLRWKYGRAF